MSLQDCVQKDKKGLRISLHVQPGAAKTELSGLHGEALKLRVAARAQDGAANKAVCLFLAEIFSVPKTSVSILRGETSRQKTVLIEGEPSELMLIFENLVNS